MRTTNVIRIFASGGATGTNNPNIIEYHTIPKPLHFQRVARHSPR